MVTYFDGESGRELVRMSLDTAMSCSGQGAQDANVAAAMDQVEWLADADTIRRSLKRLGAWDAEELADDGANRARCLWVAACDIRENPDMYPED